MFKTENLSKRLIIAAAMLSVLLLAVFFLGTSANADDVDDAAEPAVLVDEYGRSADGGVIALKNTEYAGGPYFRLCLHGYQKLAPDATVTVTAYLPGTLIPFYRATFTKDYLVFKDTVNLIGGVLTQGASLRLPAVCQLKIEVNGDNVDGWKLIYGTYVEEAAIWSPSTTSPLKWFWEVFGSDYVYGNATCLWATNFGGHVVHLRIDGAAGGVTPDPDVPDPNPDPKPDPDPDPDVPDPKPNPDPDPDVPDPKPNPDPDPDVPDPKPNPDPDPDVPDPKPNPDPDPDVPDPKPDPNPDPKPDPDTPDKPVNPDKPSTPDKPSVPKTPSKTGDSRSIAVLSAVAIISLAVLAGTYRKKRPN